MALNLQQGSNKITLQLFSFILIAETRLFKATWQQLPQAVFLLLLPILNNKMKLFDVKK